MAKLPNKRDIRRPHLRHLAPVVDLDWQEVAKCEMPQPGDRCSNRASYVATWYTGAGYQGVMLCYGHALEFARRYATLMPLREDGMTRTTTDSRRRGGR